MADQTPVPNPVLAWLDERQQAARAAGRLWVTVSYAQTLDGSITVQRGQPLAISGPQCMALTHRLRAMHAAILVGIGTLLADNPRLTARLDNGAPGPLQPQPVILDSRLRCPPTAAVFQHIHQPWLAAVPDASQERRAALQSRGTQILTLPAGPAGGVSLPHLLDELQRRQVDSLFVEGGASVISAFLSARLAQALIVTIAPRLIGGQNALVQPLDIRLKNSQFQQLGEDWLIWGDLP